MNKFLLFFFTILTLNAIFTISVFSIEPEEFLKNPDQELRARNISKNIRCLICQNQSIDDSSSELAQDLRVLIRDKIKEGLSDEEIYIFLSNRYGDFILLKPPLKISTYLLWILPSIFFFLGILTVFFYIRKVKKI